jgi:hypothetical protein
MGRTSHSDATTLMVCEAFEDLLLEVAGLIHQEKVQEAAPRSKGKAKAFTEGAASTPKKKSEKSTMSKEARKELEERKEKIKQMELVLDMRNAKEKDKQKVIREFLSNMVDPLFPFQNQLLENASGQPVKVDISQLKQVGINWTYRNVVEERAIEIQSLMFMATSIIQRPSIYMLPVENDPEKPGTIRVL